jgi:undecaprenyl-diphosphatase
MSALPQTMLNYITQRDLSVMQRLNSWRAPRWIRLWMICATRGGDGWLWYAMSAVILLFGGAERFSAVCAGAVAATIGVLLFMWLKKVTHRRRPCAIASHCWATLLPPDQFSFPSGHSITAFAFAVPFSLFYPSLVAGLMFCAVSIALSRVIMGMHFLSDVVAGSAIGASLGYCAFLFYS